MAHFLKRSSLTLAFVSTGLTGYFIWDIWGYSLGSTRPGAVEESKERHGHGGHGAAAPSGHGHGHGGHGAAAPIREPASSVTLTIDDIYASLGRATDPHSLVMGLELELFDDTSRDLLDKSRAAVRHAIIEAAMEQKYRDLTSYGGKLYFKEVIVARINTFLNQAAVRDAHFVSFYVQ